MQAVRLQLYRENIGGALDLVEAAHAAHPDSRYAPISTPSSAISTAWMLRFICHKAACVPGLQPRPAPIIARSTAHRPKTRRNRAHFAARARRNFLSFICHKAACMKASQPRPGSIIARSTAPRPETRRKPRAFRGTDAKEFPIL